MEHEQFIKLIQSKVYSLESNIDTFFTIFKSGELYDNANKDFYSIVCFKIYENIKKTIIKEFSEENILNIIQEINSENQESSDKNYLETIRSYEKNGFITSLSVRRFKELLEEKYHNITNESILGDNANV